MRFAKLECVVLERDIPKYNLRAGDVGTVVEIYPEGGLEVEFITGAGTTQALLTMNERDIRRIGSDDLLTTRRVDRVAPENVAPVQ